MITQPFLTSSVVKEQMSTIVLVIVSQNASIHTECLYLSIFISQRCSGLGKHTTDHLEITQNF